MRVDMSECSINSESGVVSLEHLAERLDRMEALLINIAEQRTTKEFYSTAEVAELLGKKEFTVREWARLRRINASKRLTGRGNSKEWIISHNEIERIQNKGLLPRNL